MTLSRAKLNHLTL